MPDELVRRYQAFAEQMRGHPLADPRLSWPAKATPTGVSPAAALQTDGLQTDALQTDALQTDTLPTDRLQTETLQPATALANDWLTRPEWVHAEFEAALLVATAIEPDVAASLVRAERDALLSQLDPAGTPWEALAAAGFGGDHHDYQALANSRLDLVFERRRGIPITLAVLLLEVSRHFGFAAVGINHPGHFLVQVEAQLVDPFTLQPVAEPSTASAADPLALLLRMLNNVKGFYLRAMQWDRALDLVSLQLAVAPASAELWCEKGDLWTRIGGHGGASRAYREALDCLPANHPLTPRINDRLAALARSGQDVLH